MVFKKKKKKGLNLRQFSRLQQADLGILHGAKLVLGVFRWDVSRTGTAAASAQDKKTLKQGSNILMTGALISARFPAFDQNQQMPDCQMSLKDDPENYTLLWCEEWIVNED